MVNKKWSSLSLPFMLCVIHIACPLFESGETSFYMLLGDGDSKDVKGSLLGSGFNDNYHDKHTSNLTDLILGGSFRTSQNLSNTTPDQVYMVLYNSVGEVLWWMSFDGITSWPFTNITRITGSANSLVNGDATINESVSRYQILVSPSNNDTTAWFVVENGTDPADRSYPLYLFSIDKDTAHPVLERKVVTAYLGCYDSSVMSDGYYDSMVDYGMTADICANYCQNIGKAFALLTYGARCLCGEDYPLGVSDDTGCNVLCYGNTSQICGSDLGHMYSTYRIDIDLQPLKMPEIPLPKTHLTKVKTTLSNEILVTDADFLDRPTDYIVGIEVGTTLLDTNFYVYYNMNECNATNRKLLVNSSTFLPLGMTTGMFHDLPLLVFSCLWIQFNEASLFNGIFGTDITLAFVNDSVDFLPAAYLAFIGYWNNTADTSVITSPSQSTQTFRYDLTTTEGTSETSISVPKSTSPETYYDDTEDLSTEMAHMDSTTMTSLVNNTTQTDDIFPSNLVSHSTEPNFHSTVVANESYSTQSACCPCMNKFIPNITSAELEQKLQEMKKNLAVEKKSLSSSKRKLISVSDDRTSARGIGFCGALVLAIALLSVVLMDFNAFYTMFRSAGRENSNNRPSKSN